MQKASIGWEFRWAKKTERIGCKQGEEESDVCGRVEEKTGRGQKKEWKKGGKKGWKISVVERRRR